MHLIHICFYIFLNLFVSGFLLSLHSSQSTDKTTPPFPPLLCFNGVLIFCCDHQSSKATSAEVVRL